MKIKGVIKNLNLKKKENCKKYNIYIYGFALKIGSFFPKVIVGYKSEN